MKKEEMTNDTISVIQLTTQTQQFYHQAFMYIKQDNYHQAQYCLDNGNKLLLKAHQIHAKLLNQECELDLLLVHAEDMLMSLQLYKSMMKEFIDLYKTFPTLRGNKQSL
ncbi:PTS lactose/cellobiose transporter subunit IIA [Longibaculum muris]|uniref:PTS lactose/cellobiose transporter subunit IIA n=1 Tax=Longibaculum muris TaxID=1796628 RepID=UPI001E43335C|nr:PTS lactose/cellobiose transporter subunit IIA [Longibaculum muris]